MGIREDKGAVVEDIKGKLSAAKAAILTDYRGMDVAEATALRKKLRAAKVEYRVLKNTLVNRAAQEIGYTGLKPYLEGTTAVAFGYDDPVAVAKAILDFSKDSKHLTVKAGVVEGKVVDEAGVKALANLPSREVLLAMVLSGMQAPLRSWVSVLNAPIRSFAYALDSLRKEREPVAAE